MDHIVVSPEVEDVLGADGLSRYLRAVGQRVVTCLGCHRYIRPRSPEPVSVVAMTFPQREGQVAPVQAFLAHACCLPSSVLNCGRPLRLAAGWLPAAPVLKFAGTRPAIAFDGGTMAFGREPGQPEVHDQHARLCLSRGLHLVTSALAEFDHASPRWQVDISPAGRAVVRGPENTLLGALRHNWPGSWLGSARQQRQCVVVTGSLLFDADIHWGEDQSLDRDKVTEQLEEARLDGRLLAGVAVARVIT